LYRTKEAIIVTSKNSLGTYEKCQYCHLLIELTKATVGRTHIDQDVPSESCSCTKARSLFSAWTTEIVLQITWQQNWKIRTATKP
jgi:hypothetical protein